LSYGPKWSVQLYFHPPGLQAPGAMQFTQFAAPAGSPRRWHARVGLVSPVRGTFTSVVGSPRNVR